MDWLLLSQHLKVSKQFYENIDFTGGVEQHYMMKNGNVLCLI